MIDITIPPEALEAAARAAYETPVPAVSMIGDPPWENAAPIAKEYFRWQARAACLALIKNWPGMVVQQMYSVWSDKHGIILPLPQETSEK